MEALESCEALPKDHKVLAYIKKQAAYKKRRYEKKIETSDAQGTFLSSCKQFIDREVTLNP